MGHAAAEAPTHPPAHRYPPPRARPRPDPCHAPSVHRRSGRRRAGTTGRPASQPSCRRSWRPALPLRPGLTGSAPTTPARPGARPRAVLPGRSRWGGDPRRAGAARTTPHLRPIRTPAPTGALDGERHRSVIADRDRVGGGRRESSDSMHVGVPADVAACEIVAPRAPPRPRMGNCDDEARPGRRTCSAVGADGPVAGGPAAQKGGWRVSFTPRPAPLPARSGAMTPFPMSAGAAAHPKVTRRPPFSPRRRPGPRRWGPPEVFTHPGRHRHRPVHDGGRCRSDVPREAARRTEGLIPVRAGPVVRDAAPEVGGGGAPREPRRGAAWSASTSLNPRARTPGRRARGLPDDLAG